MANRTGGSPRHGGRQQGRHERSRAAASSGLGSDGGHDDPVRAHNGGGLREAADGGGPNDDGQADTGRSPSAGTTRHKSGYQRDEGGRTKGCRPPPPAAGKRGRCGRWGAARADRQEKVSIIGAPRSRAGSRHGAEARRQQGGHGRGWRARQGTRAGRGGGGRGRFSAAPRPPRRAGPSARGTDPGRWAARGDRRRRAPARRAGEGSRSRSWTNRTPRRLESRREW